MLLRFHDAASAALFLPDVQLAFRQAEPSGTELIAVDWHGRQYLTLEPSSSGDPMVYRADIGFGDFVELVALAEWREVVGERPAEVLDGDLLDRFLAATDPTPEGLAVTHCIGYTTPLFLGGEDAISNLAVSDLEVYWTLGSQLLAQVRDLPPGTPISGIRLS